MWKFNVALIFWPMIHFELLFVYGMKSNFTLNMDTHLSQCHLLKLPFFTSEMTH
jgi:hypothetical protein